MNEYMTRISLSLSTGKQFEGSSSKPSRTVDFYLIFLFAQGGARDRLGRSRPIAMDCQGDRRPLVIAPWEPVTSPSSPQFLAPPLHFAHLASKLSLLHNHKFKAPPNSSFYLAHPVRPARIVHDPGRESCRYVIKRKRKKGKQYYW